MDWEKYIALVNTLDLKFCDLRYINIDIKNSLQLGNVLLGRLGYFTSNFYTNLIKVSQYIKNIFCDRFGEYNLSIVIKDKKVRYDYKFYDVNIKNCLIIQKEYKDKKILNMDTLVTFNNPIKSKSELYISVSYIDEGLNHIVDVLDFRVLDDIVLEIKESDQKLPRKIKGELDTILKHLSGIREYLKKNPDLDRFNYSKTYVDISYECNEDSIEISYNKNDKGLLNFSCNYIFENNDIVMLTKQIDNGLDTGVILESNNISWRL